MAEAFLRRYAGDRFEVYSAGLEPEPSLRPLTLQTMREIGFDMQGHYPKGLHQYVGQVQFDYLISLCDWAIQRCPFLPGMGKRLCWAIDGPEAFEGPDEEKVAKFRQTRDLVDVLVRVWIEEMRDRARQGETSRVWRMDTPGRPH